MADEQLGRLLLIKRNTVQDGSAVYENVCGLQDRSFSMSTNKVERLQVPCDTPEDPVVRTVSAGVQTLGFKGNGLFKSSDRGKAVMDDARLQRPWYYQVVVPGYGSFTGPFLVDVELNGPLEGDLTFSGSWDPTDTPTFAAA